MTLEAHDALDRALNELFDAERTARRVHQDLLDAPTGALVPILVEQIALALKQPGEGEASMRLVRIALLLGSLSGEAAVDALVDILDAPHSEARHAAAIQLEDMAHERFKEVALGVERALSRLAAGSPALRELPGVIVEVPEPGVTKLLGKFLRHSDADAVASAIEALVDVADPSAVALLEPLQKDKRTVELVDESTEGAVLVTLGELAAEAIDLLSSINVGQDDA